MINMPNKLSIIFLRQVSVIIWVKQQKLFIDFEAFVIDLGLDVHDCESLSFSHPLQSGNVITIEPGKSPPVKFHLQD